MGKSDVKIKENIHEISALPDSVLKLNSVQFNFTNGSKLQYGFIAQQVETVYPNLVYENREGIKSVAYVQIIPLLLNQIKDLTKRVEKLESERNLRNLDF